MTQVAGGNSIALPGTEQNGRRVLQMPGRVRARKVRTLHPSRGAIDHGRAALDARLTDSIVIPVGALARLSA